MMRRTAVVLPATAILSAFVVLPSGRASDHLDGPRTIADPQADIADLFAFTSPERPGHLVLAMTLTPFASQSATFSPEVDYIFRLRAVTALDPLTLDTTALDVTCDFVGVDAGAQTVTCSLPSGVQAHATVGDSRGAPQGAMRVFAGLRADPAFFDRQGALATAASGRASFTGQNAFASADVLAIVVEVDPASLSDAGAAPSIFAVAAETVRRGL
jgi:Domain of unknown function (DUF4331)